MDSLQQVIEELALLAAKGTNATASPDASSTTSAQRGPINLAMTTFKMLFSASALRDWAILLAIGSLFETARRLLSSLWHALIGAFFITAVFSEEDVSFRWIIHWLSHHPSWKGARNVEVSTLNCDDSQVVQIDPNEDSSPYSRKVTYLPAVSESYTLWYKYRWMGVTRTVETFPRNTFITKEKLTISIMARNLGILAEIIRDAKNGYIEAQKDKITIFVSDRYQSDSWNELATRPKRPLDSIILDTGITELLVEDVRDFLSSREWYAERGIPFRRGYLLYGPPGTGKTSVIHSIAGELGLDVYIVSLSRSEMDDTALSELISALPERCIALMEDIDAAFHHGLTRESPQVSSTQETADPKKDPKPTGNRVSLSGLLNALDGIGAQEGRVLFATTNKYSSLDPALCRPGRMDLHIEFKLTSRFQAEELFKRFYAPSSSASVRALGSKHAVTLEKCENGHANVGVGEDPLIDLSESQAPPASSSPSLPSASPSSSFSPSSPSPSHSAIEKTEESENPGSGQTYIGILHNVRAPTLSEDQINALAGQFALAVPERQLSIASLQGFLMMHKMQPFAAVADIAPWVEKELTKRGEGEKGEKEASVGDPSVQ